MTQEHRDVGANVLYLLNTWTEWVHRRVETFKFSDPVTLSRRLSTDFALPADVFTPFRDHAGVPLHHVPLALLRKRKLTNFDLRDETGKALPLLTARENSAVAAATLVTCAEAVLASSTQLGESVPEAIQRELWAVAASRSPVAAGSRLRRMLTETSPDRAVRTWQRGLLGDAPFLELAFDLARNFLVIVPLAVSRGERRIVKVSYDFHVSRPPTTIGNVVRRRVLGTDARRSSAPATEPLAPLDRVLRGAAIRQKTVVIPVPAIGQANSYHADFEAPNGLQLTRLRLFAYDPAGKTTSERDAELRSLQRAHVFSNTDAQGVSGVLIADLRPRKGTIVRAGLLTSTLALLLLVLVALALPSLRRDVGPAVALLLLVPGTLSAYVSRPREDEFTSAAVFGLRVLAAVPGACAVLAATVLVFGRRFSTAQGGGSFVSGSWEGTPVVLWCLVCVAGAALLTLMAAMRSITALQEQRVSSEPETPTSGRHAPDGLEAEVR